MRGDIIGRHCVKDRRTVIARATAYRLDLHFWPLAYHIYSILDKEYTVSYLLC